MERVNTTVFEDHDFIYLLSKNTTGGNKTTILTSSTDISSGWISPELYLKIQNPLKIFTLFLEAIAVLFSITNITVYTRKAMNSPTSLYLVAYNVAVLTRLSLSYVTTITGTIGKATQMSKFYLIYGYFVDNFVYLVFQRFMFCLTCLVCAERLVAVAFPLQSKQFRIVRSPVTFTLITFFTLLTVHVYHFFKYDVILAQTLPDGSDVYSFRNTNLYLEHQLLFANWALALRSIFVYSLLLVQFVINVLTVVSLKQHGRQRQKIITSEDDNKKRRQEHQLTMTILVSTFLKVLLNLPMTTNAALYDIMPSKYGFLGPERFTYLLGTDIGFACDLLSLVTDFLCYVLLSSTYRAVFCGLFASAIKLLAQPSRQRLSQETTSAVSTLYSSSI